MHFRIGHGYDVHKFAENRKLIIGGVHISYPSGLLGHSDADVLTHAIIDALLGAAKLGDIGQNFPDTNEAYRDADSLKLLDLVGGFLSDKGYSIGNIDATIVAEAPKLQHFIPQMEKNIATALKIPDSNVNIKATTEEGLGFTGAKLGIAAHAVCLIQAVTQYIAQDLC